MSILESIYDHFNGNVRQFKGKYLWQILHILGTFSEHFNGNIRRFKRQFLDVFKNFFGHLRGNFEHFKGKLWKFLWATFEYLKKKPFYRQISIHLGRTFGSF